MRFKIMCYTVIMTLVNSEIVISENVKKERNSRFLKFDTTVDGDIGVDLELSIPFVKIPIKKIEAMGSDIIFPTINVNIVGMALGGIAILGTALLLPFLTKAFGGGGEEDRYGRSIDQSAYSAYEMLQMGMSLLENGENFKDCTLRLACLAAKQSTDTDSLHTMKQISRNPFVSSLLNSTAIDDALRTGWLRRRCLHRCPIDDERIHMLLNNMSGIK